MSNFVIKIESLTKTYKRFSSTWWKVLATFGFPVPARTYNSFTALKEVGFSIKKGERVALVGRNGAGKSTLLKIISGQLSSSSGSVHIDGTVQALTELGTGFHPDFSGIENIKHSLALNGYTKNEVTKKIDEIVEFTELHDFIDRPVKEYSAGMYARLAFAVSAEVRSEILVIDEILGAGDAYFLSKCVERMKEIANSGATILFVSHDMSAVQMLCERAIWIQSGQVRMDADTLSVSKSYMAAVRDEEEKRLVAQKMNLSQKLYKTIDDKDLMFRFIVAKNTPASAPALVRGISFFDCSGKKTVFSAENVYTKGTSGVLFDQNKMNWRDVVFSENDAFREVGDFGGEFNHAPFFVANIDSSQSLDASLSILPSKNTPFTLEVFNNETQDYQPLLSILSSECGDELVELNFLVDLTHSVVHEEDIDKSNLEQIALEGQDIYGSKEVSISNFYFFDEDKIARYTLISGKEVIARIELSAFEAVFNPVAVIAIYKMDGTCATQLISRRDEVEFGTVNGKVIINCRISNLQLGPGDYICSVGLFKDLDLTSNLEPEAYCIHDRVYPLKVFSPPGIGVDIGTVNQRACWDVS